MSAEREELSATLEVGWGLRAVVLLIASIFPTIGVIGTLSDTSGDLGSNIAGVVFTLLVASPALIAFRPIWHVDARRIERRFWKRRHHTWDEITAIDVEGLVFVVTCSSGPPLRIGRGLTGIDVFAYFVLTRVPGAIGTDVAHRHLTRCARRLRPIPPLAIAPEPPDPRDEASSRWRENPFFVLGLTPECSRADVERAGQKLLGLLAIGSSAARSYETPLGNAERTPDRVRSALAELRDPERRLVHEAWARLPAPGADALHDAAAAAERPWDDAMAAVGWRRG